MRKRGRKEEEKGKKRRKRGERQRGRRGRTRVKSFLSHPQFPSKLYIHIFIILTNVRLLFHVYGQTYDTDCNS